MDTKKYERLLSIVMERLEQVEIEKNWLALENKQLKELNIKTKEK